MMGQPFYVAIINLTGHDVIFAIWQIKDSGNN